MWMMIIVGLLVLGLIVGNLLLLKDTAKRPLPKVTKDNNANYDKDEDDDWKS
jgi:F0F1-type ATP synthase assembly protein I